MISGISIDFPYSIYGDKDFVSKKRGSKEQRFFIGLINLYGYTQYVLSYNSIDMLLGPKGNPLKAKGSKYRPSDYAIGRTMKTFLAMYFGIKRESVSAYFTKAGKRLSSLDDCIEFLRYGGKFK